MTTPSEREIVMTRTFDAPRELVWEALSKPEHMREWWGPRGFTMPVCEMDFRVGGAYRFVQKGPDGAEYGFRGEYREIVPPERIGWTFEFEGMSGSISLDTMTLTVEDGKTTITTTSVFDSVEQRDGMLESGMETGAAETYDRLAELLEEIQENNA
ncbi:MAG: SRPBCC family protein [Actinomycetota bacterium]|nr:SRPBCC family protein [Actinomycetota bacterium]